MDVGVIVGRRLSEGLACWRMMGLGFTLEPLLCTASTNTPDSDTQQKQPPLKQEEEKGHNTAVTNTLSKQTTRLNTAGQSCENVLVFLFVPCTPSFGGGTLRLFGLQYLGLQCHL